MGAKRFERPRQKLRFEKMDGNWVLTSIQRALYHIIILPVHISIRGGQFKCFGIRACVLVTFLPVLGPFGPILA
jgi:hypothetical protein